MGHEELREGGMLLLSESVHEVGDVHEAWEETNGKAVKCGACHTERLRDTPLRPIVHVVLRGAFDTRPRKCQSLVVDNQFQVPQIPEDARPRRTHQQRGPSGADGAVRPRGVAQRLL